MGTMTERTLDECLELLSDRQRRQVIQELRTERHATLEELAAAIDDGNDGRLLPELRHNHLPKLADHDVVEYDPRSGAVRYYSDPRMEAVTDAVLEAAADAGTAVTERD